MNCQQISTNFYKLEHVFSTNLVEEILENFKDTSHWRTRPDANNINRLELNLNIDNKLTRKISFELYSVIQLAEVVMGKLYPNSPQLWFDHDGYTSELHKDLSPNLAMNIQVYLEDGIENMGTGCFDNNHWYQVPYKKNFGYMLLYPTKIIHGMNSPVVDSRISVYQSYRSTLKPVDIW